MTGQLQSRKKKVFTMRKSTRNQHRSPSPHLTIKTEDLYHPQGKLLKSCRGRDLHGPRVGAKMEPMTTKASQRPSETEITISDTQKTLVKKMEELVGQHHYRTNSGVASHANITGSTVIGAKQSSSQIGHSKKVSLNLENSKKSAVFTPVQPGNSHSSTHSSDKKLSAMRSLDNSKVFDLNALIPCSQIQSAKQSLTATPKRALINIGAFSATTQKREDHKDQEGRRFYNRLFKRLEEESPHLPSTMYSPRHSGALSHRNSPRLRETPAKAIESTIKKTGQLFKNKEDSDSTAKKHKIEQTCNFGQIEISPSLDLKENNSSFTDTLNAEGNISIQSFLKESPDHRPQPHISSYQPPAMELKATPLNNDSDSSPQPIRLTKQYMRRSLKSSVGDSIKHKWKSDRNGQKSSKKNIHANKNKQLFKTFQSNGGYKSQEFSFTNDPNMSRNSVLHTLSSNDSGCRPKDQLDLSFTSSKINYSSTYLEDVERGDLHSSMTSRPGTARAKSSCYHSFKTPAQIVKPKHAASPSSTSTNQKENKNSAPKWKYSYKPDQKGKEFRTTTGFRKSTTNKSRCQTPKGSSRTNTTVSTRKSENSFLFSKTNNRTAGKRKSKTGFTTPQDQKANNSATKFFLEGGNEAETPTSCYSQRNFNQTMSQTTARTAFGSRKNSRNTSLNQKEDVKFKKHNYKASPKPRKSSTDDKKQIHFALFQTENNVKYGSIPVEERTMINPEKAFKSFISSLKQQILQGAEEEAMIMKGQGDMRTIDNSHLRMLEDFVPSRPSSAQQISYPHHSITHSLAQMLNKEKYVKLSSKSQPQQQGLTRNLASSTGKLLQTPRSQKDDQNELDFELMECLSKRSDYQAFKETAPNSLIPGLEENNEDSRSLAKTLVSPLELPRPEKCNITSVRARQGSNSNNGQKLSSSEDKQHPSRSQNYSFGGGYEAADEQSTARRNIQDPQATPRLSTQEDTEQERSSKTHKFLERNIYIEQGSPEKLAKAKFEKANELRRSVTRRTPKGMKKSPAQSSQMQSSDKYFHKDSEHDEQRLNTEEGKLTVVSPAPPVSFRDDSDFSQIDQNINEIEQIKTKMEDAVQRINQKVADAEIRSSRTPAFTNTELSFGNGKNRFNFNSSKESAGDMQTLAQKKELSVIMEPSVKEAFSVPLSPFDSPKAISRATTDQNALSQIGGIFSHKTSPRISRNVISKPSSERLFSIGKHISSTRTREATEQDHVVEAKLIVEASKYRRGVGKQENKKALIVEFHKLKDEMKKPCPSFSLFYKIQTVATKIIQRNYKVFITRKRILENAKKISLRRKGSGPFSLIQQEIKIYRSSSTQTESVKGKDLLVTGEVVRRFAFNAFFALKAYCFLLQRAANKI